MANYGCRYFRLNINALRNEIMNLKQNFAIAYNCCYKLVFNTKIMSKKIKLEFTERQLECLISLIDTIEAMQGASDGDGSGSEFDEETQKEIKNIDRMFKMNGYTRRFS